MAYIFLEKSGKWYGFRTLSVDHKNFSWFSHLLRDFCRGLSLCRFQSKRQEKCRLIVRCFCWPHCSYAWFVWYFSAVWSEIGYIGNWFFCSERGSGLEGLGSIPQPQTKVNVPPPPPHDHKHRIMTCTSLAMYLQSWVLFLDHTQASSSHPLCLKGRRKTIFVLRFCINYCLENLSSKEANINETLENIRLQWLQPEYSNFTWECNKLAAFPSSSLKQKFRALLDNVNKKHESFQSSCGFKVHTPSLKSEKKQMGYTDKKRENGKLKIQ